MLPLNRGNLASALNSQPKEKVPSVEKANTGPAPQPSPGLARASDANAATAISDIVKTRMISRMLPSTPPTLSHGSCKSNLHADSTETSAI
jgi:hypothetical protein